MPWYKVPLVAYLEAAGPEEAREQVLGRADVPPHGPLWEAAPAAEMTPRPSWRRWSSRSSRSPSASLPGLPRRSRAGGQPLVPVLPEPPVRRGDRGARRRG